MEWGGAVLRAAVTYHVQAVGDCNLNIKRGKASLISGDGIFFQRVGYYCSLRILPEEMAIRSLVFQLQVSGGEHER